MAIRLICPSCQSPVDANEADRGMMIACDQCAMAVEVPEEGAPAPVPVKRVVPVARVKPAPVVPVAKPLKSVTATPAEPTAKASDEKFRPAARSEKPQQTRKQEEDDDRPRRRSSRDDDDDRPRRRSSRDDDDDEIPAKKKSPVGIIIAIAAVLGMCLIVGVGGMIWYFASSSSSNVANNSNDAEGFTQTTGVNVNGTNANTQPGPQVNVVWTRNTDGDGFSVEFPESRTHRHAKATTTMVMGVERIRGFAYSLDLPFEQYEVKRFDIKSDEVTPHHQYINAAFYGLRPNTGTPTTTRKIGNHTFQEYTLSDANIPMISCTFLITKIGQRVYIFRTGRNGPSSTYEANSLRFLNSIQITYEDPEPLPPIDTTTWVAMPETKGFTAKAPVAASPPSSAGRRLDLNELAGEWNTVEQATPDRLLTISYFAGFYEQPMGAAPDLARLVLSNYPYAGRGRRTLSKPSRVDDKPATEWTILYANNTEAIIHTVNQDNRIYVFGTARKLSQGKPTSSWIAHHDAYMNTIKFTGDVPPLNPISDWVEIPKTLGFIARGPKVVDNNTAANIGFGFGDSVLAGSRYTATDSVMQIQISVFPITPKWDAARIIKELQGREAITSGPNANKLGGEEAQEYIQKDFFGNAITLRTANKYGRVFAVRIARMGKPPEKVILDRTTAFFDNFQFKDNLPPLTNVPNPDPNPNPGPNPVPNPTPQLGKNPLIFAGRIEPFWAGVPLPVKKEFLAIGSRDVTGKSRAGTLRRYSYPDFKLIATYQLPNLVLRAAADEKAGKLYCAIATRDNPTLTGRDPAYLPGAIHIYDLKSIVDGSLKEDADIKPLSTLGVSGNISGMEMSMDGANLYVSSQIPAASPRLPLRGRIYRFDLDKVKADGEIEHQDAITGIKLSSDGKKLLATVVPQTIAGPVPAGRGSQLMAIATGTWKKSQTWPVPGLIADAALPDDQVVALVVEAGSARTYQIGDDNMLRNITPDTGGKLYQFLRTRPDNNYAVAAASYGQDGVYIFDVRREGGKITLLAVAAGDSHDGKPVGGQFVITADNNYAITNSGSIIDLVKTIRR